MGRHQQPEIRQRLLESCTDHALAHGLPDRLTPMAVAAGTSTRMLIYHFGTRDELLQAVLRTARARQIEVFSQLLQPRTDEPYAVTLARAWQEMTGVRGAPYLRMFGQLRESSEQRLWPDFRRTATTDWLDPLEKGMGSIGRPELATLVLAVIRGLLMDLDATGDTPRVGAAFAEFLASFEH